MARKRHYGRLCQAIPGNPKRKFHTKADALLAALEVHGYGKAAYRCPHCGAWHLTRRQH